MGRNADPSTPISDRFDLEGVIRGLADDLVRLRTGNITPVQAMAAAQVAKQIMNGVRLVVNAQRFLEARARELPDTTGKDA